MGLGWYDDEGNYRDPDPLPVWVVALAWVAVGIALGYLLFAGP